MFDMLSVVPTVHQNADAPAAEEQPAFVSSWPEDNTNGLKRKGDDPDFPDCCAAKKRSTREEEQDENFLLRPEVTLTVFSQNSCISLREFLQSRNIILNSSDDNNMVCNARPAEQLEGVENPTSQQIINYFVNFKEIQLTKITPPEQNLNVINQEELFDEYSPDEDDEKSSNNCSLVNVPNDLEASPFTTALVADLPAISIIKPRSNVLKRNNVGERLHNFADRSPKRYGMTTRIQSRLEKATTVLLREQENEEIKPVANFDSDHCKNNNNFVSSTGTTRVKIYDFNRNRNSQTKSVLNQDNDTIICPSLFNEEPQVPATTATNNTADADFDSFNNLGVAVDDLWLNAKERPYYAHGLPNPVGENRCWVNATLQSLFRLPVFRDVDTLDRSNHSKLIKSLAVIQNLWKKGMTKYIGYTPCFNNFKEELSVLDKGYSSRAQQDVSEFIMNLLNFIKTEFESKSKESQNSEIENIPNNVQDTPRKSQSTLYESNKRSPLADISASAGQSRNSQATNSEQQDTGNTKNLTQMKSQTDVETEAMPNPIDENFTLYMVENYICGKCAKTRQQKVENLMLFIDLPSEDWGDTLDLVQMINTSCGTEYRELTCESCKHDKHTMNLKLKKLPKILTVQVKRYEMTSEGLLNKKSTAIEIPRILQLDHLVIYNDEEFNYSPTYEPVGIISHIGDSIDSGHYISFVKHQDKWFYYDDASVRLLTDDEVFKVVQNNAYMIFFQETESCKNYYFESDQRKGG